MKLVILFLVLFSGWTFATGLPQEALKKVEATLGKENACFILKKKGSSKPEILFGKAICQKSFPLGNRFLFPLSVIATELSLIQDEKTLFKWDGTSYPNRLWNKDQFVTDWLNNQVDWVTDRLRLQIGSSPLQNYLKAFQLEGDVSAEKFLGFVEHFFLGSLPVKKSTQEVSKPFFYIGKYRYGSEVWGQKASGNQFASFSGQLVLKNQAWVFTTFLNQAPRSDEPLTAERAQALSMDVLSELGLF